jgi:hypothetical protein
MRRAVFILGLWLALWLALPAAEVKFAWNANPEPDVFYRLYRDGSSIATTGQTEITVDRVAGSYTLTAYNDAGESEPTAPITIPAPNATRLTIQVSTDMETWTDLAVQYDAKKPRAFYRLKMEVQP